MTFILRRYNSELQTSEMFNTDGRTVKSGLVGSAVVSSWTWAATLLQSSGKHGYPPPYTSLTHHIERSEAGGLGGTPGKKQSDRHGSD